MGWWPFSSGSSATQTDISRASPTLPPTTISSRAAAADTATTSPPSASPPQPSSTNPSDHDDIAVNAWLATLESAAQARPDPSTLDPTTDSPRLTPDGKLDISPRALRPRSMSCRQAFDQAWACAGVAGRFKDMYRFGTLQPCGEQWDAFWFCLRTKTHSGPEKGRMIADYYEEREGREMQRRSGGRTSEDVWEIRTEAVERAFWKVP